MLSGIRKPKNTAVFVSGGGSTLQALLEMRFQLNVTLVVSNKRQILGNLKAKRVGCETFFFNKSIAYTQLSSYLQKKNIQQIFLAGYMKILPEDFVRQWENKIFNIHPSLLPVFPGLEAAEKSFKSGSDMGVTIHTVIAEMDMGSIFMQARAVNKSQVSRISFNEALFLLRRTEQHLLREYALRRAV